MKLLSPLALLFLFKHQLCDLSSCLKNTNSTDCADIVISDSDINSSLTSICGNNTNLVGCSLWKKCQQSKVTRPYCSPYSVLYDVCTTDPVNDSMCGTVNALCARGKDSVNKQCQDIAPFPLLPSTSQVSSFIVSICTDAPVLANCTGIPKKVDGTSLKIDNLSIYASLCSDLSSLDQCQTWTKMCDGSQNFGPLCDFDGKQRGPSQRQKPGSQSSSSASASATPSSKPSSSNGLRQAAPVAIILPLSIFILSLFIH